MKINVSDGKSIRQAVTVMNGAAQKLKQSAEAANRKIADDAAAYVRQNLPGADVRTDELPDGRCRITCEGTDVILSEFGGGVYRVRPNGPDEINQIVTPRIISRLSEELQTELRDEAVRIAKDLFPG